MKDPRPTKIQARYRQIPQVVAVLAELERKLQEPKVRVLHRTVDLPADVISDLKLEYTARVKELKTMVEGLPDVYQGRDDGE